MDDTTTAALEAALEPVQAEYDRLDGQVQEVEARLSALRDDRRRVKRVLDALKPPAKKPAAKPSTNGTSTYSRRALIEFLANADPAEDITTATIHDAIGISRTLASTRLIEAHQDGLVRLDRTGVGGLKVYRVLR